MPEPADLVDAYRVGLDQRLARRTTEGGFKPLQSWLSYRRAEPAGRARSSTSRLDRIRPQEWTADLDTELLEVIWTLERTLSQHPNQQELLEEILAGDLISADELPQPTEAEREPPDLPS